MGYGKRNTAIIFIIIGVLAINEGLANAKIKETTPKEVYRVDWKDQVLTESEFQQKYPSNRFDQTELSSSTGMTWYCASLLTESEAASHARTDKDSMPVEAHWQNYQWQSPLKVAELSQVETESLVSELAQEWLENLDTEYCSLLFEGYLSYEYCPLYYLNQFHGSQSNPAVIIALGSLALPP